MAYPPDYNGFHISQDTNIDQSILKDLFEMQDDPAPRLSLSEFCEDGSNTWDAHNLSVGDFERKDRDPNADSMYANLPDLSDFEEMIDWDDIKDVDEPPANSNQNYRKVPDSDFNSA
jgi:hypothetical protein